MEFKKAFISELKPAKYNPRKDLTDQDPEYLRIKRSIEEFGYVDPVIVNADYTVIGGHQRIKVLRDLGHASIDVVVVDIPKIKEKALNIALNKITGEWDTQRLTDLLGELKADGMDISITGFDEKEFDGLLRELHKDDEPLDSEPQISRAEELRKEWGTELGQMWQCGEHRVICGDCTDPAVVERVMQGEKADMVFTDPPYGIGYEYSGEYKDNGGEKYLSWCREWFGILKKYSDLVIITTGWTYKPFWYSLNPYDELTWFDETKQSGGKSSHLRKSEPVFIFGKVKEKYAWDTLKNRGNRGDGMRDLHTCPKPISLISDLIEPQSSMASVVLDVFLGSGTTMIACENLGRKCRGCEIDPGYVAVILQRYKDTFPGKEIRLIADNAGA
jgi:DNA modification methylase